MIPCIFEQSATTFETLGIGPLMNTISCNVVESLNGEFDLNMQISKSDKYFNHIHVGSIIVAKPNMTEKNQAFIIESISKDIDGVVDIYATHIAQHRAKLIPVLPFTANSLESTLTQLVSNSQETNPFTIETDMTSTTVFKQVIPHSMRELLGGVEGSIIDVYGGEYSYDNFKISLNRRRGKDNGIRVMYGVNMTEFLQQDSFSWTQSITGVLPFWYSETEGYIKGTIQRTENANLFPYKKTISLDCSNDFEDKPTPTQLNNFARSWLSGKGNTAINIETSFEMLSQDARFYRLYENIDFVCLGDTIHVINSEYDVSYQSRIIETNFDVLLERYNSLTIGDKQTTVNDAITTIAQNVVDDFNLIAGNISYNWNISGLNAQTVQGAIDEIDSSVDDVKSSLNVIGATRTMSNTTKNIANNTSVVVGSLSLPKGKWLVDGSIYYPRASANNSTGWVYVGVGSGTGNNPQTNGTCNIDSYVGHVASKSVIYELTEESTTINLVGWQNSGATLNNCVGYMKAIRIK